MPVTKFTPLAPPTPTQAPSRVVKFTPLASEPDQPEPVTPDPPEPIGGTVDAGGRTWLDPVIGVVREIDAGNKLAGQALGNMVIGATKGALNTVFGTAQLMRDYVPPVRWMSQGVDRIVNGSVDPHNGEVLGSVRRLAEPTNDAQKAGYFAEQLGEFFVPGQASERGAAWIASKAAPLLRDIGSTARVIGRVAPRMATEAAGSGVWTRMQGGDAGTAAAVSAVVPVAGALATSASPGLRKSAIESVEKALGGTKERFKAIARKVAPEFLDRDVAGLLGKSREGLYADAREAAHLAGEVVDETIQRVGKTTIDPRPVIDELERAKSAYRTTRTLTPREMAVNPSLAKRARQTAAGEFEIDVVLDSRPIHQLERLQRVLEELGPQATASQLVATRRAWDAVVDHAGGYAHRAPGALGVPIAEATEVWAKREATKAMRALLARKIPSLAEVNREYAFWKGIEDVVGQTLKRTAPQQGGLGRTIMAAAGVASGGTAVQAAERALLFAEADKVMHSPRFRLASAHLKNIMAEALADGSLPKLRGALKAATRGSTSATTQSAQSGSR